MFAVMRRASSLVSKLAAERLPSSSSKVLSPQKMRDALGKIATIRRD
jgi:hypothetical protein